MYAGKQKNPPKLSFISISLEYFSGLSFALSQKHNMSKSTKCFRRFLSESAKCSALRKEIDDSHPPLPSLTASIINSSFLFSVIIGNHKV